MLVSVQDLVTYMDISLSLRQQDAAEIVLSGLQSELESYLRRPIEVVEFVEEYKVPSSHMAIPMSSFFYQNSMESSFYTANGNSSQSSMNYAMPPETIYLRNSPVARVLSVQIQNQWTTPTYLGEAVTREATVTSATKVGTKITFTAANHKFTVGQYVTVTGITPTGYNVLNKKITELESIFTETQTTYDKLKNSLSALKSDLNGENIGSDIVVLIDSHTSKTGDVNHNFNLSMRRSHSIFLYIIEGIKKDGTNIDGNRWSFKKLESFTSSASGMEKFPIEVSYSLKELGYDNADKNIIFRTINYGSNNNGENSLCNVTGYTDSTLTFYAPNTYGCRSSNVSIDYNKSKKVDGPSNVSVANSLTPTGNIPTNNTKPPLDLMKRIIMKTLSEDYYFKKLEETSPMIYSSLKEKLKYFHPGFHSMTPEGLNSRLTFLQQCLRPGNTIPIKGLSDNSDINARNTTFGPPPICVLRVGDFYNSKVIIKDLNIQFEQNVWDMNPEGIGIQPMIADVTMQLSFLGGQGLEKPVERLQNALSSNFFANTEMYDERADEKDIVYGFQSQFSV